MPNEANRSNASPSNTRWPDSVSAGSDLDHFAGPGHLDRRHVATPLVDHPHVVAKFVEHAARVVTSVRLSSSLREAVKAAVKAGMDANPNDAMVNAVRDRLEAFTQRLALDVHYERYPDSRPSLAEIAIAAAQLDDSPLTHDLDLLRRAADEVVRVKPDADADDVLVYAAALQSRQAAHDPTSPAAAAS